MNCKIQNDYQISQSYNRLRNPSEDYPRQTFFDRINTLPMYQE